MDLVIKVSTCLRELKLKSVKIFFSICGLILSANSFAQNTSDTLANDLITAVLQRNSKLVLDLISRGADVNYSRQIKYDGGKLALTPSPLSQAAAICSHEIVQILITNNANIDFQWQGPGYDTSGATPLMLAARGASFNPECELVVESLIKSRANPLIPNVLGEIPLHALLRGQQQNDKTLNLLLKAANYTPEHLNRALSLSILNSDADSVFTLLSAGANPNSPFGGLGPTMNNFEAALRAKSDNMVSSTKLVLQYLISKGGMSNRALEMALNNGPSFRLAFIDLLLTNNYQVRPDHLELAIQNSLLDLKDIKSSDAKDSLSTIRLVSVSPSINVNGFLTKALTAQYNATGSFEILSLLTKAPSFNKQSQEAEQTLCYAKLRKITDAEQILLQAGVKENCKP